jgi:hypothetical protein
MLARPATAGQATFEPDDDDDDAGEPLPAFSLVLEPPLPDVSPDEEADEPFPAAVSAFLLSEPFADAAAGSDFWLERLSVR